MCLRNKTIKRYCNSIIKMLKQNADEEVRENLIAYKNNKPWFCEVCKPRHNYKLWGKEII